MVTIFQIKIDPATWKVEVKHINNFPGFANGTNIGFKDFYYLFHLATVINLCRQVEKVQQGFLMDHQAKFLNRQDPLLFHYENECPFF